MNAEETERHKAGIDSMDYEDCLRLVRFAPSGHPFFVRGTVVAEYFAERMKQAEAKSTPGERVAASKRIGWDGP